MCYYKNDYSHLKIILGSANYLEPLEINQLQLNIKTRFDC